MAGLATTLGSGAMTNSIGEIVGNDVLFIIGSNATEAHPIIGNKMKQAHLRGAKLIVVDPRRTELAEHAHLWLRLKPGTDNALVNGMLHTIISNGWHDQAYIDERTEGFDDLWETVKDYPAERAAEITGVPAETIVAAAKLYATTRKAGIFYTLGITEHTVGTANVMNLANLGMVTGHIGIENAGVNPMRGQNNVQGSCDMGALPNSFPGYPSVLDDEAQKQVRRGLRRARCRRTWACASRRCSISPCTAPSRRCSSWARTRRSPTPTPTTCARRSATSTSSSCRTSS